MAPHFSNDSIYVLRIYVSDLVDNGRTIKTLVYRAGFFTKKNALMFFGGYKSASYRYLPSEAVLLYSLEEEGSDYFTGSIEG